MLWKSNAKKREKLITTVRKFCPNCGGDTGCHRLWFSKWWIERTDTQGIDAFNIIITDTDSCLDSYLGNCAVGLTELTGWPKMYEFICLWKQFYITLYTLNTLFLLMFIPFLKWYSKYTFNLIITNILIETQFLIKK